MHFVVSSPSFLNKFHFDNDSWNICDNSKYEKDSFSKSNFTPKICPTKSHNLNFDPNTFSQGSAYFISSSFTKVEFHLLFIGDSISISSG